MTFDNISYSHDGIEIRIDAELPPAAIIGFVGPAGSGALQALMLAGGAAAPDSGSISQGGLLAAESFDSTDPQAVLRSIEQAIDAAPRALLIGPSLALLDRSTGVRLMNRLHHLRRSGATVVIYSHDLDLIERHADEVLAFEGGAVIGRGDSALILGAYRERELRRAGSETEPVACRPASRHGNRRITVESVRLTDELNQEAALVHSGAMVSVRVALKAQEPVENPVVGIMIRARVGVTVYGTNTELERVSLGPLQAGERLTVCFRFNCDLCPGEYTVTAASHEPGGTPHDWLEEALLFSVEDSRYTAGVANLRASVSVEKEGPAGGPESRQPGAVLPSDDGPV